MALEPQGVEIPCPGALGRRRDAPRVDTLVAGSPAGMAAGGRDGPRFVGRQPYVPGLGVAVAGHAISIDYHWTVYGSYTLRWTLASATLLLGLSAAVGLGLAPDARWKAPHREGT